MSGRDASGPEDDVSREPLISRKLAPQDGATLSARDLLALQAFELAARSGSFKAAAETLHITASAVSHRIAGLERALGEKLFEREPRGVELSRRGRQLAANTGRAFGELARAMAHPAGGGRRLRLSCVPIFASHWLLPRLGEFIASHPEIELQVEASPRMADMEAGLVDAALRYGDGTWPDVSAERIMDLHLVPVTSPVLARRLKLGKPADLVRAPLIRVAPFGTSWTKWAGGAGLDPARFEARPKEAKGLQVDGMGASVRAASHGLGVALVFDPLIDSEIRSGALMRVGPAVPARGQVWLVCRPRERSQPAIRALRRWLLAQIGG